MELSDPHVIDALLAGVARASRSVDGKLKPAAVRPAKTRYRSRCTCGQCAQCRDNERWESIYNAKFADPDYYAKRPVRHASSLDGMV